MQIFESGALVLAIVILIAFQVKHFLADFVLQNKYMLKKVARTDWFLPLISHSAVHALGTFIVLVYFIGVNAIYFALVDFAVHTGIDAWKARMTEQNVFRKAFWVALGLDQLAHQLTYIAMAFIAIVVH